MPLTGYVLQRRHKHGNDRVDVVGLDRGANGVTELLGRGVHTRRRRVG